MKKETLTLGFTGTQTGMTQRQSALFYKHLKRWLSMYERLEFHHGDCIGADAEAHALVVTVWPAARLSIVVHPPSNESKRAYCSYENQIVLQPLPYLERNHAIVDAVVGMVAAPKEPIEQLRSGTWATVRYSAKQDVPVILMEP